MAYHHAKQPSVEHVYEDTMVWKCSSCIGWSRKEFLMGKVPVCPLCNSEMVEEIKNIRIK